MTGIGGQDLSVLFVCTGNRFRSALAESLFRGATEGLPVRVSSAGTQQLAPGKALPEALELGLELGVDLGAHRSRPLRPEIVEGADLVVGFEQRHVKVAVVEGGAQRERTFTAGELAALLRVAGVPAGDDPAGDARAAIAEADRLRTRLGARLEAAELPDPFGGDEEGYRASAAAVDAAVGEIAFGLFGRALPVR